jgi:hypothetical protein
MLPTQKIFYAFYFFAFANKIPEKKLRYRLNRRLGGPQSRSGHLEIEKFLPLEGFEPRITQTVA